MLPKLDTKDSKAPITAEPKQEAKPKAAEPSAGGNGEEKPDRTNGPDAKPKPEKSEASKPEGRLLPWEPNDPAESGSAEKE